MNNPLLYPFLCICGIFAFAFGVWCYFAIKERRHARSLNPPITESKFYFSREEIQRIDEARRDADVLVASLPTLEVCDLEQGQPSYGSLYRHHGHRHALRPENRADRRRKS